MDNIHDENDDAQIGGANEGEAEPVEAVEEPVDVPPGQDRPSRPLLQEHIPFNEVDEVLQPVVEGNTGNVEVEVEVGLSPIDPVAAANTDVVVDHQPVEEGHAGDRMEDPPPPSPVEEEQPVRRNTRFRGEKHVPVHLIYQLSFLKGIKKYGRKAIEAAFKELQQMLDQKVWTPVNYSSLSSTQRKKLIRSFMFLKEKFKPDGTFDKLKMRLVAGGHLQNKLDYDDISSPTISLIAVFVLVVIAAKERRKVVTVDIAGAYLNAKIINSEIHMVIDAQLADLLVQLDDSYRNYLRDDGCIVVKLKKALYGCIESAKL